MGNKVGKEDSQEDSQYYEKVSFQMNILVCGNYEEKKLEEDLEQIKLTERHEGAKYIKMGLHKKYQNGNIIFFPKIKI